MPHFWRFYVTRYRGGNGSGNEESLAAIWTQKEGRPDCWWVGRDFLMIFRISWANPWELTVPDYWDLIAAKNASFSGHFERPVIGADMTPKMKNP